MGWREKLLATVGPGSFAGITLGDWLKLLRENQWSVSPAYFPRAAAICLQTIPNTVLRAIEQARFQTEWGAVSIQPPIFILGHYRHGTTHLHNLLSVDKRFCFPTMYQVSYPHTFLTTEQLGARIASCFAPAHRPFDNVRFGMDVPSEDEMATIVLSGVSPYLSGVFPRRETHYDTHLTFLDASDADVRAWQEALLLFFKKLTLRYSRPIVAKSPPHTARIRWLLEMFPDAKFVHIHRNPFEVFSSTLKMVTTASPWFRLQRDEVNWEQRTLRIYREMYDAYFQQRGLIPTGQLYEIGYEELVSNPLRELQALYEGLDLPPFSETKIAVSRYIASIASYKTNQLAPLGRGDAELVATQWKRSFDEWGYDIPGSDTPSAIG